MMAWMRMWQSVHVLEAVRHSLYLDGKWLWFSDKLDVKCKRKDDSKTWEFHTWEREASIKSEKTLGGMYGGESWTEQELSFWHAQVLISCKYPGGDA